MHFVAGLLISMLMLGMPLAFAVDLSHPPAELTGWLVFVISLCGVLGLLQLGLTKYILKPAIMDEMKGLAKQKEFNTHVEDDKDFQGRVDDFMDDVSLKMGVERRHRARRKGDPQ